MPTTTKPKQETAEKVYEDYKVKAVIAKVSKLDADKATFKDTEKRVFLTLATEPFATFDKEGKETTTNSISLNSFALLSQIVTKAPESTIAVLSTMALGESIRPDLFALCLQGAEIVVNRTFHKQGETNADGQQYEHDCYTSEIVSFVEHISPIANSVITTAITTNSIVLKSDEQTEANKAKKLALTWQW